MDCIFCKIVKGEIDSAKIFEDDEILVFLDVNPDTKGHCLVVPKKHYDNIFDVDSEVLKKLILIGKNIAIQLKRSLSAVGINILNNNGKDAGQIIPHFHIHIIPRYESGQIDFLEKPTIEELKKLALQINSE